MARTTIDDLIARFNKSELKPKIECKVPLQKEIEALTNEDMRNWIKSLQKRLSDYFLHAMPVIIKFNLKPGPHETLEQYMDRVEKVIIAEKFRELRKDQSS